MMEFSLWKHIKRRLRRNRRPLWMLGGITLWLFIGACSFQQADTANAAATEPAAADHTESIIQSLQQQDGPLSVKLHRVYVCGEELKPLGRMKPNQIVRLLLAHPAWTVMLNSDQDTVVIEEQIDDLSNHCKTNAYMGLDKNGNLTLYDGAPKKQKVVRTFFQLDVRFMESSLPQDKLDQLANGIRISDMDEYNSVLSTYSDYAVEKNEKVMKPAY